MKTCFEKHSIGLPKNLSMCTDDCLSMVGTNSGFICLLMKHLNKDELLTYNRILRQDNLAAKFGEDFMSVIKDVVPIVNFT
jgi:hypothetical protein